MSAASDPWADLSAASALLAGLIEAASARQAEDRERAEVERGRAAGRRAAGADALADAFAMSEDDLDALDEDPRRYGAGRPLRADSASGADVLRALFGDDH